MISHKSDISRVISRILLLRQDSSRILIKYRLSANRLASSTNIIPYLSQTSRTCWRFSSEKGCPPIRLVPASIRTKGMLPAPTSSIKATSLSISTFPLKGWSLVILRASAIKISSTLPPLSVMCDFVVVK